jgi:tripartite ATP-independent transporter DctM subunit
MELTLLFIVLFTMLFLGFPIYAALIGSSLLYVLLNDNLSFLIAVQRIVSAPNSFTLLAVPFFILAGQIMNNGGVTTRIFRFAKSCVGHLHGGLGYVNIVSSIIFAGMSGSALADAGGLGMVEIEAMRKANYDEDFSIGVTAASSIIGPIIPPSIPFVIYGAVAGVSVGGLFVGGILPGLLMASALFVMVFVISRRRKYQVDQRASFKELTRAFGASFLALLTPVVIIGGIWGGFFTPTEAAFVSIVYALLVTIVIYGEQSVSSIPVLMSATVRIVAPAIVIVAAANLFGWILNYERVDRFLVNALFNLSTNKYVILLIINLLLLVLGMFLEVISAIMLLLPILGPVILLLEIHPIHFGVILVLNLMIGLLTPPVGFVLYVLASATKTPVQTVIRYILPWTLPLLAALILITFLPQISLYLPTLGGFVK